MCVFCVCIFPCLIGHILLGGWAELSNIVVKRLLLETLALGHLHREKRRRRNLSDFHPLSWYTLVPKENFSMLLDSVK